VLEEIETQLADENIGAAEQRRLRPRADFVGRLLKLNPDPARPA
jgi:hypothetical protein